MKQTIVYLFYLLILSFLLSLLAACSPDVQDLPSDHNERINERISPDYPGPPELKNCSKDIFPNYDDAITLSGIARFHKRNISSQGLGGVSEALPIRYAEIRVVESNGTLVQCGETGPDGSFHVEVPRSSSKSYTLRS